MSLGKQLHKLGEFSFKHPWRVISFWVVILGILGISAAQFYEAPSSTIAIPGTQAQQAIDRVEELFPDSGGATGRIVFHTKDGVVADHKDTIESLIKEVGKVDGVAQAISPFIDDSFVADDKQTAYAQVQLEGQTGAIETATLDKVQELVADKRSSTLQIESGGDLVSMQPEEILGVGEIIGVGIALIVLVMTLGSIIAAGMPILSALTTVGVSMAGLFAMSQAFDINSTTPVLAVMLGLAVGIDYALFIVNKHRTLVEAGYKNKDAAAGAIGTAGNAVVFAALTVIIALAALSVVNIPFMTVMGLVGAASIGVAALVSISLIPALLGLAGDRVFSKKQRAKLAASSRKISKGVKLNRHSFWHNWGEFITKRPITVLVASVAVIAVIALPVKDLQLGLPSDQYAAPSSTERKAYDLLSDGFGAGFNAPLILVAENLPKVSAADEEAVRKSAMDSFNKQVEEETTKQTAEFQRQLQAASTPQEQMALQTAAIEAQQQAEAKKAAALAEIEKTVDEYAKYVQLSKVADEVAKLNNVERVQPAVVKEDGTAGLIQIIPSSAPVSAETDNLIDKLRDNETITDLTADNGAKLSVTGAVALQGDINEKLSDALPTYVLVIVGLSLILLLVAFRSILVPIKATLGFVLSVLAMFGATVAVFQWGWFGIADAAGPIISFVPIIATGILFGLAMDYEFFLVSGIHESYVKTKNSRAAIIEGFGVGSKVVTAAAVIMIGVFAGFITNQETVIQSIGFGLAIGILIDAFLVRMTIVPAVLTLLGKSAWWLPKWLDKILPHISIEGENK